MRRFLLRLAGFHLLPPHRGIYPGGIHDLDLQDIVPDDIGVTGPHDGFWYVTARYDFAGADEDGYIDHGHAEIKLDKQRYDQLCESIVRSET